MIDLQEWSDHHPFHLLIHYFEYYTLKISILIKQIEILDISFSLFYCHYKHSLRISKISSLSNFFAHPAVKLQVSATFLSISTSSILIYFNVAGSPISLIKLVKASIPANAISSAVLSAGSTCQTSLASLTNCSNPSLYIWRYNTG